MAMIQTWIMSIVLLIQSFIIPLVHPPSPDPVDYGGDPYVDAKAGVTDWLYLFEGGETAYSIVVGAPVADSTSLDYTQSVQTGAKWLQEFIGEMTGVTLPIIPIAQWGTQTGRFIAVGDTGLDGGLLADDLAQLGNEGFVKRANDGSIFICGVGRGTMYGCTSFIEDELDCRWFTPELKVIPDRRGGDIKINANLQNIQNTQLEYREDSWSVLCPPVAPFPDSQYASHRASPDFMAFHKLNSSIIRPHWGPEFGYGYNYNHRVGFCHTLYNLLPKYILHPEYDQANYWEEDPTLFSYRKSAGGWTPEQRCLSKERVYELVRDKLFWGIATYEHTEDAFIASVTHEDNSGVCECEDCLALDAIYGGPTGTYLQFVNRLAAEVEREFPDKEVYIDTFAYGYTLGVPEKVYNGDFHPDVIPRHNVIVRLCSIDCCFVHPFSDCGHRDEALVIGRFRDIPSPFAQHTRDWRDICAINGAKLYVWDYTTNFKFYPTLFPNFQVLAPNIQFLIENGVMGIFEQGNIEGSGKNGEFAELRAYVLAKLLWNPTANVEHMIEEFMAAYYGPAAPFMKEYLDTVTRISIDTIHLTIFGRVEANTYFRPSQVRAFDKLFDQAEEAAAGDPEALKHVQLSRIHFRCLKANYMIGEFAWRRPIRRLNESKKLFHDSIMAGIDAYSQFMAEPYNLYTWLHRPFDWGAMKSWIDFVDLDQVHNMTLKELDEYRQAHS